MSLETFARYPLLFGPSPVHRLDRLTAHLGGATLWAKRDGCNSGLAYGGNKTRKLEYLVADALAKGCDTLVGIGFKRSWEEAIEDVERAGGKPYAIPAGASDHPLGGLGFARWAAEVEKQERELGVFFDTIVVCSVTGSTQAGMVAGFAMQERERRVLGIDGSATVQQTWDQVARIARNTARAIGLARELRDDEIVLLDEWHAGTYGIPDARTIDAIRLCARLEGMLTDPVYEGKSMAALIDLVAGGEIEAGSTVLYAHLGGQPAL